MAAATLFHPILQLVPPRFYLLERGNYFGAFIYYTASYLHNSILYLADVKYLVIGLERHIAMKNRHTYETRDGSDAKMLLLKMVPSYFIMLCRVYIVLVRIESNLHDGEKCDSFFVFKHTYIRCEASNDFQR